MKRTFVIIDDKTKSFAVDAVNNIGYEKRMVVTIEPHVKKRTPSQNKLQWVSMLGDISEQAVMNNRLFSVKIWHEYFKEMFLPNEFSEGKTLKNYVKWQEMPNGVMKMVGSTTGLTKEGFSDYITECYAYGSGELGVRFSVNPRGMNE